jgi:hypothetical protein
METIMTNKTPSHVVRKVTALIAKTTEASGCTAGEKLSAYQLAVDACAKHHIDRSRFEGWPDHDRVEQWRAMVGDGNGAATEQPATPAEPIEVQKPRKRKQCGRADKLMELLSRDIGVSLPELMGEFGILKHTARAYLSTIPRSRDAKAVLRDGRYYLQEGGD